MRHLGLRRGGRVCVRALGGGSEAAVITDCVGRVVLSNARQRGGVVTGDSQVGEAAVRLVLTCSWTLLRNLLQSRAPALPRPVSLLCSGTVPVSGDYAVQCFSVHPSPRHMGTRAGEAAVGPAVARHISRGVSASLIQDVGEDTGKPREGGVGSSCNGRVVCARRVVIATAKEFPPSSWSVQPCRVAASSVPPSTATPRICTPHTQWAAEERSRTSPDASDTVRTVNVPRYPKHVWSPAGGWYAQPANWKANTAVVGLALGSIVGMAWMLSANREYRDKMPERHRFFPSR
jgi:hypothetical protein